MNIPHRILTPDDPDTGIPGKYTETNSSNECVTTPQSSYGDVSKTFACHSYKPYSYLQKLPIYFIDRVVGLVLSSHRAMISSIIWSMLLSGHTCMSKRSLVQILQWAYDDLFAVFLDNNKAVYLHCICPLIHQHILGMNLLRILIVLWSGVPFWQRRDLSTRLVVYGHRNSV